MNNIEIERKFLLNSDIYKPLIIRSFPIIQGYISAEKGHSVRVRLKGEQAYLTIKGRTNKNGISRFEWEREISVEDAKALLKLCHSGIIEKTRHIVPSGKHFIEIDEFYGDNQGLVIAEIELESENEQYDKPAWLGKEVTGDYHYYNSYLAKAPFKKWQTL
ncbi:MAG: CYTH domain-containing protein [Prevotellaceae bacterium]|jgi:CYTH domain-containing protein|nr:CYTH domain-containing protein [Prevotellaceae bacterium]